MSATIAAALKKIAVSLLSNKKVLKTVFGIILGIVIILAMPIAALIAIFNGSIQFDVGELHAIIEQNLSNEEQSKLQRVEVAMTSIEEKMIALGFSSQRVKEAQVIYTLAVSEFGSDDTVVTRLVNCFATGQSDSQLINSVNTEFGTSLNVDDFVNVMRAIRAVYISTDGYTDPTTKNNLDIVEWAKFAAAHKWGYVWGTYGSVLTESYLESKANQYPDEVGGKRDYIESHWLGGRTSDCVGLIKGYGWLDPETNEIGYATNGMPDIGSDSMYYNATEKGTIDTIPEIPGLAVWMEGHIGIYIGGGKVVEAKGTYYGVVETDLATGPWTHWLKIPYITYIDPPAETTPTETQPEAATEETEATNNG